jgi:hypothetical protein
VIQLKNIFLLLSSLFFLNGESVEYVSINKTSEKFSCKLSQKSHQFSIDKFIEDSSPNEDLDLEEDTDETDEDFVYSTSSKTLIVAITSLQNHSFDYPFSHQSIKKFILYCSLKLHC